MTDTLINLFPIKVTIVNKQNPHFIKNECLRGLSTQQTLLSVFQLNQMYVNTDHMKW